MKTGVLILAGGRSERMHFPKPYLQLNGRTFLEHISETYLLAGVETQVAVLNSSFCREPWEAQFLRIPASVEIVQNDDPDAGRGYSLRLGLDRLAETDFVFIQNIDNPFIHVPLIRTLLRQAEPVGYSTPIYNERGGHPILITAEVVRFIRDQDRNDLVLKDILQQFPRKRIFVEEESVLWNINTPEDYSKFTGNSF